MSDLSDDEKSPRRDIGSSTGKKAGDGSGRSVDIPLVYHLTSSDNTGAQVIACILNGDNYMTWSRAMLIALRARNKLPLIDSSLEKPGEGDPLRDRWERCNSTLLAWIFNTMEERLQATVAYAIDAKSLWDDLKERYSEGNQSRVFQIKAEICLLRQEGLSVRDYYGKLKLLWDELEFYLEHPSCCCGARATITAQREMEKTYQFLMGLTSEFNTIRSTILSIESMPSLNKVYNLVANEERQRIVTRGRDSVHEAAVFLAKNEADEHSAGKALMETMNSAGRAVCSNCGKLGHLKNTCWALIGYPSWHPRSKIAAGKGPGQGQSKQFGGPGQGQMKHFGGPRGKGQYQRGPDRANMAQTGQQSKSRADRLEDLPDEQFQKLLSMLSQETKDPNQLVGPHLEKDTWSG
ncbi:hypothetical protein CRG98_044078 [Punica granatum]|uniref:CCHC-type domain-containing protein n=1 Tax=Punica granatum TaxID=22663 RepID=A0A2I0HVA3_PUNGR|nr:hypothetical protein CRG98_044078 [Punica granatum]